MPSPDNKYEAMAADAARRIEAQRDAGQQLTFLPDEPQPGDSPKAARGKGKALNQMRDWLAARGYRLPEDVIAQMAGLASRDDAIVTAMANAERVIMWAADGATNRIFRVGEGHIDLPGPYKATPAERLAVFMQLYTIQLRALEALLPYGLAKVTPDAVPQAPVQVFVAGGAAVQAGPDQARDVTPQPRRVAPPPMPQRVEQNQGLSGSAAPHSDGALRTEGPSA